MCCSCSLWRVQNRVQPWQTRGRPTLTHPNDLDASRISCARSSRALLLLDRRRASPDKHRSGPRSYSPAHNSSGRFPMRSRCRFGRKRGTLPTRLLFLTGGAHSWSVGNVQLLVRAEMSQEQMRLIGPLRKFRSCWFPICLWINGQRTISAVRATPVRSHRLVSEASLTGVVRATCFARDFSRRCTTESSGCAHCGN